MRMEELKKDMPVVPDFIHTMICEEVDRQVSASKVVSIHTKRRSVRNMQRVAAAAVVCLLASSTAAYAGSKLYHLYLEKQGTYGTMTGIHAEGAIAKLPAQIHGVSITSDSIPEGMEWTEEGSILNYKGKPYLGGISIAEALMDTDDLSAAMLDTQVVESEERSFGAYSGVYLRYDDRKADNSFNQRIYMICPEFSRVLTIYISDDVKKEDAVRFAEGLKITETEDMINTEGLYTWSDIVHPEILAGEMPVTEGKMPIHRIGESFALPSCMGEDAEGRFISNDGITVRVDDVQIADDLSLLDDAQISAEWKNAVDDQGRLLPNHIACIRKGDGVDHLNQVVKEETVDQKLVYTTVTYTNTSQSDLDHMLFSGSLMTLRKENDGTYMVYDAEEGSGEEYDYRESDGVARTAEMSYYDVHDAYGDGGNYIRSLKAGESVSVHMAWIVNETDLPHMYLNLNGTGNSYTFDEEILKTGLVWIGEVRP